jgi:hypothetical protein
MMSLSNIISNSSFCKIIPASRDLTTASGSQSITGVGFRPSAVEVLGFVSGTQMQSDGWCDSVLTQYARFTGMNIAAGSAFVVYGSGSIVAGFYTDATLANNQIGAVSAFTSDGCTLTWTKTGVPTGTATLYIKFWQ